MALAAGTRLGPYSLEAAVGAGGMGQVYRAKDTRLDRTVAIKVLPTELASDPQFRARFEREARTISQLTHPHICTLHDVGVAQGFSPAGGLNYLVMEYLEGETLAARLAKGPLPVEQAREWSMRIRFDSLLYRGFRMEIHVGRQWIVTSEVQSVRLVPRGAVH